MRKLALIVAMAGLLAIVAAWLLGRPTPPSFPPEAPAAGWEAGDRERPRRGAGNPLGPALPVGEETWERGGGEQAGLRVTSGLEVSVFAGGAARSGAEVRVYRRGPSDPNTSEVLWEPWGRARTGPEGIARIASPPGTFLVSARAEGAATARSEVLRPSGEGFTRVRLELAAGAALRGELVDASSGQPLPLAELLLVPHSDPTSLRAPSAPEEERVRTLADARGRFVLGGLAPGAYQLEARRVGYSVAVAPYVEVPQQGRLVLSLRPAATLEGFVVDAQGRPVEGAELLVTAGADTAAGTTGPGGGFSIEVVAGAHHVMARQGSRAGALPAPVTVGAGQIAGGLRITLAEGGRIEGRVLGGGEEALGSAQVDVSPFGRAGDVARARTNPDGRFSATAIPPGIYDVVVNAEGHAELLRRGVVVQQGQTVFLELSLSSSGAIAGRVLGASGEPAGGARVEVASGSGEGLAAAVADAEGRFRLEGLAPGRAQVTARGEGGVEASMWAAVGPDEVAELTLTLKGTGTIEGTVRWLGRGPPGPLFVQAYGRGSGFAGRARVEADGRFSLAVPPGRYSVMAFGAERFGERPAQVEVPSEGAIARCELELGEERAIVLRGRVLEPEGAPAVGAWVRLAWPGGRASSVRTDGEGAFELSGSGELGTEPARLLAQSGGRAAEQEVVPDGRFVTVRLSAPASLKGRVRDLRGLPIEGFTLQLTPAHEARSWAPSAPLSFTGERFVVHDLVPGPTTLTARGPEGRYAIARVEVEAGRMTETELVLHPPSGVRGRLGPRADGTVMAGVEVRAHGGGSSWRATSRADGSFGFEELPPGAFLVVFGDRSSGMGRAQFELGPGEQKDLGELPLSNP